MPVLRQHHTRDFTVIPNSLLQDQRLSCRERGLLVWMLSKPQDWNFSHKALLSELPFDKKGAVQACINKLTEIGYLRIVQERTKGKLGKTLWYVYDVPYPKYRDTDNKAPPYPEIPDSGKSTSFKKHIEQKKSAVPATEGGAQLPEGFYYDPDSREFRRKEITWSLG